MKKLVLTSLISLASFNLYANADKADFVNQLSLETCHQPLETLYVDIDNKEFDMANVLSYSWIALQTLDTVPGSYEDDKDADLALAEEKWGLKNIKLIDNDRWQARTMIAEYNGNLLVTFRHTNSNLNWLMDADFGLWDFNHSFALGEKVHHGFGTMLGSMWDEVVAELRARNATEKKVAVFGHSLGAALAMLAGTGLVEEGFNVQHVYATGSPKVGGAEWAKKTEALMKDVPVFRISNKKDLIAQVPLTNESLDEFGQVVSFVPGFLQNAIGNRRSNMPYGLSGQHVQLDNDGSAVINNVGQSLIDEQVYWNKLSVEFTAVDEAKKGIIYNFQTKAKMIADALGDHSMRAEEVGYTCNMTKNLLVK